MKAKVGRVKQMVMPALGIGAGMLASPKVAALHPTFAKYPELSPFILLVVAVLLLGTKKGRTFGIGLGAVCLVFLIIALYNRVKGKAGVAAAPSTNDKEPWTLESVTEWIEKVSPRDPSWMEGVYPW